MTTYVPEYYDAIVAGSLRSARAVLPLVLDAVHPASALDVGCGTGAWAAVMGELGVADVVGIDGDYVQREQLLIPGERFLPADLEGPVELGRRFDLVASLEVAEHLPAWAAATFVATLVRHADVVLFSAAIPRQGGNHHVNEQWPEYWAHRFAQHGYAAVDHLRPRVWHDTEVELWYAQNLLLFVREERLADFPRLAGSVRPPGAPLAVVHPRLFDLYRPWSGAHADPAAIEDEPADDPDDLDVLVASADRPARLERLLRSAQRHVPEWGSASWTVVHAASDAAAAEGYERVRALHPDVVFVDAGAPAALLDHALPVLGDHQHVAVVDDAEPFGAGARITSAPRAEAIPRLRRDGFPALPADPDGTLRLLAGERLVVDGTGWQPAPATRGALVSVAYADEVLERPELLRAYAEVVSGADDATLVLYAPDEDPAEVAAALGPVLAWAGLDADDAADLELLCVPRADGDRVLAATAAAVLSGRTPHGGLVGLVHLDADAVALVKSAASLAEEPPPAPGPVHAAGVRAGYLLGLVRAGGHRRLAGSGRAWERLVARLPAGADHAEVAAPEELPGLAADAALLLWLDAPDLGALDALAHVPAGTTLVVDGLHRCGRDPGTPSLLALHRRLDELWPGHPVLAGPDTLHLHL